jgi:hypothetical protein
MTLNTRIDKDGITKKYLGKNDVFADLFNYYLYDGKQIIDKNNLVDVDTNLIINNPNDIKRVRDIYKRVEIKKDNNTTYLLLGIENQTSNLNGMVLRNLLYDVMSYDKQALDIVNSKNNDTIKSKRGYHYKDLSLNDKLSPVITLVVYFNHKKWSGHKRFIDMINVSSPAMKEYIIDYKLNIIEPNFMTDDDFNKFKTEIGLVLESVKYSNDKKMFLTTIQNKMNYKNMNVDTADFIKSVVNLDLEYEEKDGKINMCKAIEDLKKDWKAEGIELGKTEGLNQSIQTMHTNGADEKTISQLLSLDIKYVKKVLAK